MRTAMPLLLLTACAEGPGGLEGVEAVGARLTDLSLTTVAIMGGTLEGDATLEIDTVDGDVVLAPVRLEGGAVGAGVQFSVDIDFDVPLELDLTDAGGRVSGNDLLGSYDGSGAAMIAIAGVHFLELRNPAGVELDATWFALGFGTFGGVQWLRLALDAGLLTGGHAPQDPDDSADTGGEDTGGEDTGDTAGG